MGAVSVVYVLINLSDNQIKGVYTDESETRVELCSKTEETKQQHEVRNALLVLHPYSVVQL